jgi:hypothetical protein
MTSLELSMSVLIFSSRLLATSLRLKRDPNPQCRMYWAAIAVALVRSFSDPLLHDCISKHHGLGSASTQDNANAVENIASRLRFLTEVSVVASCKSSGIDLDLLRSL